jgi:RHS repeat-associated protein
MVVIGLYGFQYLDSMGLVYLINRYYDPTTDQFLSVDPMISQTDQPYVFTNDSPLNATDPLGLKGWYCMGGVVSEYYNGNKYGAVGAGQCGSGVRSYGCASGDSTCNGAVSAFWAEVAAYEAMKASNRNGVASPQPSDPASRNLAVSPSAAVQEQERTAAIHAYQSDVSGVGACEAGVAVGGTLGFAAGGEQVAAGVGMWETGPIALVPIGSGLMTMGITGGLLWSVRSICESH